MEQTFAYYTTIFREDFTLFCKSELQKEGISLGLLYFVIYIGKNRAAPRGSWLRLCGRTRDMRRVPSKSCFRTAL
ncbi:Uncharacterised protein [[Clostridium] symbiosum]|uniref:hypothetical protein n=1 Tax=Clostridium symbiosum TaxID=1512 RepID=UPI000E121B6B|nr:hypothetical protein [[Clostridium] symbiosum]STC35130.1 Uncharacterised protein [[Clostridium] symbiosum]